MSSNLKTLMPSIFTDSASSMNSSIRQNSLYRQFMSALAKCGAVKFGNHAFTAQHILPVRDWFKMLRINARKLAACVVQFETIRDRSNQYFINHSMRASRFTQTTAAILSIAFFGYALSPEPTTRIRLRLNVVLKHFFGRKMGPHSAENHSTRQQQP